MVTTKPYSACTFVRRQLDVRGKTEHSGRGSFDMEYDIESSELEQRLLDKIKVWEKRGLVEKTKMGRDDIEVVFVKGKVESGGSYRTLRLFRWKDGPWCMDVVFSYEAVDLNKE